MFSTLDGLYPSIPSICLVHIHIRGSHYPRVVICLDCAMWRYQNRPHMPTSSYWFPQISYNFKDFHCSTMASLARCRWGPGPPPAIGSVRLWPLRGRLLVLTHTRHRCRHRHLLQQHSFSQFQPPQPPLQTIFRCQQTTSGRSNNFDKLPSSRSSYCDHQWRPPWRSCRQHHRPQWRFYPVRQFFSHRAASLCWSSPTTPPPWRSLSIPMGSDTILTAIWHFLATGTGRLVWPIYRRSRPPCCSLVCQSKPVSYPLVQTCTSDPTQ